MKTLFFFLLFIFIERFCIAQKQLTDSLKHQLAITKKDTDRVLILADLCLEYRYSKPDSSIKYGQQAIVLARQIKFLKGETRALLSLGYLSRNLGNLPEALDKTLKALRMAEKYQYLTENASCLNNLGGIYYELKDYAKALTYYQQSMKLYKSISDQRGIVRGHGNIAGAFERTNQLDSAIYHLKKSYKLMVQLKDIKLIEVTSVILRIHGMVEAKLGHRGAALNYFQQSIQLSSNRNDYRNNSFTHNQIAEFYQKLNQPDSSIYYAKKGLSEAQLGPYLRQVMVSASLLSELNELSNPKEAFRYYKIATAAKDSLYGANQIEALQTIIADEQERQREIEAQNTAYQNQLRQYSLLAGLGVFLLIAFILYLNNRQKQKANILLSEQKAKVEQTLKTLETTQTQLIQREKLASLGELTSGIAHEIQNPLNFVNNFSELSVELIADLKEERSRTKRDEAIEEEILSDISHNLEKINTHGKRASSIVKGMLEHSKPSTGKKELTDINALVNEYLQLAQHSFQSKDKYGSALQFNVIIETDFTSNIPPMEIIQQDIGRVLLNLINNAFYAVNQRTKRGEAGYEPKVMLSTEQKDNQILIKVKDNGTGIPENIKAKIFQPFFTTKPTGEGTGLGLSLAYDIVTKGHEGSLEVESVDGEGTEFIVKLPI